MEMSFGKEELVRYVTRQLNTFFPDGNEVRETDIGRNIDDVIERMDFCFSSVNDKYFPRADRGAVFNHLNSDHYAMFLYMTSNLIFKERNDVNVCTKLFLLNKCLHGIDVFYQVDLPKIFLFAHPIGTVLGNAKYSDYLLVYQKCNVGGNKDKYPVLGKYLSMHPGAVILGNCNVGENCKIAAGSFLLDQDLEDNSVYIGNPRDHVIKKSFERNVAWT
jgi:serine O-acetyltransferase